MNPALPILGVQFDIQRVKSGSYGAACWKVFWSIVDPRDIAGASLFEGDTNESMQGGRDVYCLAVQTLDTDALARLKHLLTRSDEYKKVCATPMFLEGQRCIAEPLPSAGKLDGFGQLVGDAWNAREGLAAASKPAASKPAAGKAVAPSTVSTVKESPRATNMPLQLTCPHCAKKYPKLDEKFRGKKVKCSCGHVFVAAESAAPASSTPVAAATPTQKENPRPRPAPAASKPPAEKEPARKDPAAAWQVTAGTRAKLEAIEQNVMSESDNFAAAFLTPLHDGQWITAEGTIQCHGCHEKFPFQDKIMMGGGMGSKYLTCPCGNQINLMHCTGNKNDSQFIVVWPHTSRNNQAVRTIGLAIDKVSGEEDRPKPPSPRPAKRAKAPAERARELPVAAREPGDEPAPATPVGRSPGLFGWLRSLFRTPSLDEQLAKAEERMKAPGAHEGTRWLKVLKKATVSGTEQRTLALDLLEAGFLNPRESDSVRQTFCQALAAADMGRLTGIVAEIARNPMGLPRSSDLGLGNIPCGLCGNPSGIQTRPDVDPDKVEDVTQMLGSLGSALDICADILGDKDKSVRQARGSLKATKQKLAEVAGHPAAVCGDCHIVVCEACSASGTCNRCGKDLQMW